MAASSAGTGGTTAGTTAAAGRMATTGTATALGSIATSRAATTTTTAAAGGLAATTTELGSSSLEGGVAAGLGSMLDSTSATIVAGAEDVLMGDAVTTTDAIASATGDAVAGVGEVADSIVGAVVGDAAGSAGVLSFLPSWLVSGGLVALGSELAFAVFAIFVLLNAGGSSDSDVVESVGDDVVLKKKDTPLQGSHEETLTTFPDEETEL
mmetsp:Transcript_10797/g.17437  ORF Transcript_10797/g.17437 Transcript_10797/m.17437 type:complete len:210 (+) Transcript_10797:788-1417(+)